jgi:hypothetical protein
MGLVDPNELFENCVMRCWGTNMNVGASSHVHEVPSPKSQHEDKVPTFEPQETIKIRLIIIKVGS